MDFEIGRYHLYLAMNDIEHTKTRAMPSQTNGICVWFNKTILQEFYQVIFRKKFMVVSMDYKRIWTSSFITTIMNALIRENVL